MQVNKSHRTLALLVALAATLASLAVSAAPAGAFGTISWALGQSREHELITRASLWCQANGHPRDCFHDWSMDQLAGTKGTFGGVGSPDSDQIPVAEAHCDDSDYISPAIQLQYPMTRAEATEALMNCRQYAIGNMAAAVRAAGQMIDSRGRLIKDEVEPSGCTMTGGFSGAAKCNALEGFGRALHTAEDFYSHTNWGDQADPTRPIGVDNPPGLNNPGLTSLFDYDDPTPSIPFELSGGCYALVLKFTCHGHITHEIINKDEGTIDPHTGAATFPQTERGKIGRNFAKAVSLALAEGRRQWQWLSDRLIKVYGEHRGKLMICALTDDHPYEDCQLKLTIKGTETVQWTVHDVETGACAGATDGSGTTKVKFDSSEPVTASPIELAPDDGTPNLGVKLPTNASITSGGSYSATGKPCGNGNGPADPVDCGTKNLSLDLQVISLSPGSLTLRNWGALPKDPFKSCANGGFPRTQVGPDAGPLDDEDLFDPSVLRFEVVGHGRHYKVQIYVGYGSSSQDVAKVTLDWTLTLERQSDLQSTTG